jgi:hypothetical protein
MANQPQQPPVIDPDNIPEILCDGQFNISISSAGFATLTFTHIRPEPGPMFEKGQVISRAIVRARIVTPQANLAALRDLLISLSQAAAHTTDPTPATGGGTKH